MARPIGVGDQVRVVNASKLTARDLAAAYGKYWREPFVVERVDRSHRYVALLGGGMLVWRKDCERLRTRLQLAKEAAAS